MEKAYLEDDEFDAKLRQASTCDAQKEIFPNAQIASTSTEINCPSPTSSSTKEPIRWSCKSCTFLNYPGLRSCEICDSPRRPKRSRVGGFGEDRVSQSHIRDIGSQSPGFGSHTEGVRPRSPSKSQTQGVESHPEMKRIESQASPTGRTPVERGSKNCDVNVSEAGMASGRISDDRVDMETALMVIADERGDGVPSKDNQSIDLRSFTRALTSTPLREKSSEPPIVQSAGSPSQQHSPLRATTRLLSNKPQSTPLRSQFDLQPESTVGDNKNDISDENHKIERNVLIVNDPLKECGVPDDMFDSWDEEDFDAIEVATAISPSNNRQNEQQQQQQPPPRVIDLAKIPLHTSFLFFASRNTERIYVYDPDELPLNVNFLPLDVETENWAALPDLLLHPKHISRLKAFLREWNSLSETKKRVIKKVSG